MILGAHRARTLLLAAPGLLAISTLAACFDDMGSNPGARPVTAGTGGTGASGEGGGGTGTGGTGTGGMGTGGMGGAGGGGIGGAGGGGVCTPGETVSCYTGPAGTKDVGSCKAGTKVCKADGSGYDACMGETLPAFDDCNTAADEDCDGQAVACTGTPQGASQAGDTKDDHVYAVVVRDKDYAATGATSGQNTGDAYYWNNGSLLVRKAPLDGSMGGFSKTLPCSGYAAGRGVAIDSKGGVVVAGEFQGTLDLGPAGGPQLKSNANSTDIFLIAFDGNGTHQWSKAFGDNDIQRAQAIAVDATDRIFITGSVKSKVDFGGGPLQAQGGYDLFVAQFGPDGMHGWSKLYGDGADQNGRGIAALANGDMALTGSFAGVLDLGTGMGMDGHTYSDVLVARLHGDGTVAWQKHFEASGDQIGRAVAAGPDDTIVVTGSVRDALDFGKGSVAYGGGMDAFVAKFDGQGSCIWSKGYGDINDQIGLGAAMDAAGNVLVTGYMTGAMTVGDKQLNDSGSGDMFVAKLASFSGDKLWAERYGSGGFNDVQIGWSIAADPQGGAVVGGGFRGSIDFGSPLDSTGGFDIFVAHLAP
jgi:hypothetical protein